MTETLQADTDEAEADTLAHARTRDLRPWMRTFIEALEEIPNIALACKKANVSRQSAYDRREKNITFRAMWDEAIEGHSDKVEETLHEVATEGHERTIYGKDGAVRSVERVKDVNAMKLWLSGNRPQTYREKQSSAQLHIVAGLDELLGSLVTKGLPQEPPKAVESPIIDVELTDTAGDEREGQ